MIVWGGHSCPPIARPRRRLITPPQLSPAKMAAHFLFEVDSEVQHEAPTRAHPVTTKAASYLDQCKKPSGWLGRFILWSMNSRHSKVTDWGLSKVSIREADIILDVGCGGGRTVNKLAAIAIRGKVYGLDYSDASVAVARRTNRQWIEMGQVDIREGSVSHLPFADGMFDLVTAVETHFWWPDLPVDMREVLRVLKPGGTLVVIAEIYKGATTKTAQLAENVLPLSGLKLLSVNEHRDVFTNAGYKNVQIIEESTKGWICCIGRKLSTNT